MGNKRLNIIIFGAPGSGKGTQSDVLKEYFSLLHISTGDVLRAEIKAESELGKIAKEYIDKGQLVPDDLIVNLLEDVLRRTPHDNGVIFDGFPRTVVQAKALDEMLKRNGLEIDHLVDLAVPEEVLVERLLNRGKVSGRSDDNEVAIANRLKVYHNETAPVVEHYKKAGKHLPIDGVGEVAEITERIRKSIEKK